MREIFQRVEEGEKVFVEVNLDVEDAKEMNPWLVSIFIKYNGLDETQEGYEEFLETKEALIIALGHNERAIYVGSRVVDGWSELYFYSYDSKRVDPVIKQILAPSNYVYETNIVRDTQWKFYEQQLFPTELEFANIQSAKIIFLLQEEGDELSVEREVEHYISFQTPTQKNRFINNLDINVELEGFKVKDEISSEDFEHGIALVKIHNIIEDEVAKVVETLFEVVKKEGGFYEGWSTVLVVDFDEESEE